MVTSIWILVIGFLKSDGAYNVIPTETELKFSMRPPPGDSVAQRAKDLEEISKKFVSDDALIKIAALESFASIDIDKFSDIFADDFVKTELPFWTEAALLSEAGVNAVVYGPGNLDQAHKPNEYVLKEHLSGAAKIYKRVIAGDYLNT